MMTHQPGVLHSLSARPQFSPIAWDLPINFLDLELLELLSLRLREANVAMTPEVLLEQIKRFSPKSSDRYSWEDQKKRHLDRAELILELELFCREHRLALLEEIRQRSSGEAREKPELELESLCEKLKRTHHLPCPQAQLRERLLAPLKRTNKPARKPQERCCSRIRSRFRKISSSCVSYEHTMPVSALPVAPVVAIPSWKLQWQQMAVERNFLELLAFLVSDAYDGKPARSPSVEFRRLQELKNEVALELLELGIC